MLRLTHVGRFISDARPSLAYVRGRLIITEDVLVKESIYVKVPTRPVIRTDQRTVRTRCVSCSRRTVYVPVQLTDRPTDGRRPTVGRSSVTPTKPAAGYVVLVESVDA